MAKTILFGGSGFLGPIILKAHPEIISAGRTALSPDMVNEHIHLPNLDNLKALDGVNFDKVVFLVGNSNHHLINTKPSMGIEYNVLPLKKVLNYMQHRNLRKFIAFTTILLYGVNRLSVPVDESQPINPYINDYVFSKYLAEEVTRFYRERVPTINVRFSNLYGPTTLIRPDLVPTLVRGVLTSDSTEVWSTKPQRDFVYAEDAADAIVRLLDTDYTGPVNLGSGEMHSVGEVVEIIERLSGKKIKILDRPTEGPMKFVTDISLVKRLAGWKPKHTLEQGLQKTYEQMKKELVVDGKAGSRHK